MANKTSSILIIVCTISILFSMFNTYLIISGDFLQRKQLSVFQDSLDIIQQEINSLESTLLYFENQLDSLNESIPDDIVVFWDRIEELSSALGQLDSDVHELMGDVEEIGGIVSDMLSQTPAGVYEEVYKSVVTIRTPQAQGSGFMFGNANLILTNWHVVEDETEIDVEFFDGTRRNALVVGTDAYADVALLKVSDAPLEAEPLALGNSSNLYVGQQVVAVGNPLGLTSSLSSGYISQVNKLIDIVDVPIVVPVLQLDITIAPGSSGGPLLDLQGRVVGITNAGTSYGFNFAVPSKIVDRVASYLVDFGYYEHPLVGFYVLELNPEAIRDEKILNIDPFQTGLLILEVMEGYPAAEAGLMGVEETRMQNGSIAYNAKDIVIAVDGHQTRTLAEWATYIEESVSPSQTIELTLWRSGEIVTIEITTVSRPAYEG